MPSLPVASPVSVKCVHEFCGIVDETLGGPEGGTPGYLACAIVTVPRLRLGT